MSRVSSFLPSSAPFSIPAELLLFHVACWPVSRRRGSPLIGGRIVLRLHLVWLRLARGYLQTLAVRTSLPQANNTLLAAVLEQRKFIATSQTDWR